MEFQEFQEVKLRALGRWTEIFISLAGLDPKILSGSSEEHPCPKCGGDTRFRFIDKTAGALFCNRCFKSGCGDGIASIGWLLDIGPSEAAAKIGEYLGIGSSGKPKNIIDDFCRLKKIKRETLVSFGATESKRGLQHVISVPMVNGDGELSDKNWSDNSPYGKSKLTKGLTRRGGKVGLFFAGDWAGGSWTPALPKPGERWLLTEGFKDASVLVDLGFKAAGCSGAFPAKTGTEKLFKGCELVLVPDLDRGSMNGCLNFGRVAEQHVDALKICIFDGKIKATKGDGVREILKSLGEDSVRNQIESAVDFDESLLSDRPRISIEVSEAEEASVADKVIAAMAKQGFANDNDRFRVYQRAGRLVEVYETDYGPKIGNLGKAGIRERIGVSVDLVTIDSEGEETIKRPPSWLIESIAERREHKTVKRLDAVVSSPAFLPDGTILQDAGYCEKYRLLFVPSGDFPRVPDEPSSSDVSQAVTELMAVVADFPFKNDAAKSVWLSLVLTLVGRSAIEGNCPLFGFSANLRGSGKTKLCDLAGIIATGSILGKQSLPPKTVELEKILTATAIDGSLALLFDNVATTLGNAEFDKALTSGSWTGRILSKSELVTTPWRTVLLATGNNIQFKADTARRVVLCELESPVERPEDRTDFQVANIEKHVKERHQRLAVLALLILRAFAVSKKSEDVAFGSFESWSHWIVGAIRFAGLPSPLESRMDVEQSGGDTDREAFLLLLDGLEETGELTSREIFEGLKTAHDDSGGWTSIRSGIEILTANPSTRTIGNRLNRFKNRIANGRKLVMFTRGGRKRYWAVEPINSANQDGGQHSLQIAENENICCGQPVTQTKTHDGYLNKNCDICGKTFRCTKL